MKKLLLFLLFLLPSFAQFTISIPDTSLVPNTESVIYVTTDKEISNLASLTLTIDYNSSQIEILGVDNLTLNAATFIKNIMTDKVKIVWYDLNGVAVKRNIIALRVKYKGTATTIKFSGTNELSDKNMKVYSCSYKEGKITSFVTGIKEKKLSFLLHQNYPNPFNPNTVIRYQIPEAGNLSVKVYNILGHQVDDLFAGFRNSGEYTINYSPKNLSSGIYFCKVNFQGKETGIAETKIIKMTYIR